MGAHKINNRYIIVLSNKLFLVIKLIKKKFRINIKNDVLSPVRRIIVAHSKLAILKYKILYNILSKNK
jgi:hypothetical protein